MGSGDDDTVYCSIQMRLATGRELLSMISELRASKGHPGLDTVLQRMEAELTMSIDIVENPPRWDDWLPTKH